jgi:aspartokinase/homoserine dehydrogenase 1
VKLQTTFEEFKTYQQDVYEAVDLSEEFIILEKLFEGVSLIGDYKKIKDQILSKGIAFGKITVS